MTSPVLAREATIVAMANALNDLERLDHEGARLTAYRNAGIGYGDCVAYDRDAFARQRQRRNMRNARDGVAMTAMFAGILALGCIAPEGEAMAAAAAQDSTWGVSLAVVIMVCVALLLIISVALGLAEYWSARRRVRRRTAAITKNIRDDAEHAARMAEV